MILRPGGRFLLSHPAHFLALGFGAGLAPVAPGTVGTLLAFPVYIGLSALLHGRWELLAVVAALFVLGIWACGRTGTDLGVPDHSAMVWDEVVAFLLILMFTPPGLGITWSLYRGPAAVTFDNAKPAIDKEHDGKATAAATFTAPGDYILRLQANDTTGDGGGGFQCCWSNVHVGVTVKP